MATKATEVKATRKPAKKTPRFSRGSYPGPGWTSFGLSANIWSSNNLRFNLDGGLRVFGFGLLFEASTKYVGITFSMPSRSFFIEYAR